MGEWSPQCLRMRVFGPVRLGARAVNLNRQGMRVWPSTAKVVRYEPQRAIASRITENRTVWSFELGETPDGLSTRSAFSTDRLLGGSAEFEEGLQRGVEQTLRRIKAEVERG